MEFIEREAILTEMNHSLHTMLEKYDLEDVGIFQEEGEGNDYYLGYTVRKNGEVYMIHQKFRKDEQGNLKPSEQSWVIECEEGDSRGYENLDAVFSYLNTTVKH
ncbi:DUF5634 family protein [Anaerobacillus isosaccharinicus]|uniref:DUF5634 family protein n=1 Tax=Anaerobacillus isosaccharinicus TaxID=1532552 RepID=A0A1S2KYH3_9BACI|nr:DUF5634 family protein [Anaerobacillus isosaccharinicus]MBA5586789.1 DUF5634 family protein [Anaerobacillus isosaccharinicus]QOY34995.1 DUF5634 family protein [Anaerobacillus isosaccharinicus]